MPYLRSTKKITELVGENMKKGGMEERINVQEILEKWKKFSEDESKSCKPCVISSDKSCDDCTIIDCETECKDCIYPKVGTNRIGYDSDDGGFITNELSNILSEKEMDDFSKFVNDFFDGSLEYDTKVDERDGYKTLYAMVEYPNVYATYENRERSVENITKNIQAILESYNDEIKERENEE